MIIFERLSTAQQRTHIDIHNTQTQRSGSLGILGGSMIKNPPAMRETWVQSLGWEDPVEESIATHSSILAWRIPMNRGAWWATVLGVAEWDTTEWLSIAHGYFQMSLSHHLNVGSIKVQIFMFCSLIPKPKTVLAQGRPSINIWEKSLFI